METLFLLEFTAELSSVVSRQSKKDVQESTTLGQRRRSTYKVSDNATYGHNKRIIVKTNEKIPHQQSEFVAKNSLRTDIRLVKRNRSDKLSICISLSLTKTLYQMGGT